MSALRDAERIQMVALSHDWLHSQPTSAGEGRSHPAPLSWSTPAASPQAYCCTSVPIKVVTYIVLGYSLFSIFYDLCTFGGSESLDVYWLTGVFGLNRYYHDNLIAKIFVAYAMVIFNVWAICAVYFKKDVLLLPYLGFQCILIAGYCVVTALYPLLSLFSTNLGFLFDGSLDVLNTVVHTIFPYVTITNDPRNIALVGWTMFICSVIQTAVKVVFFKIVLRCYHHMKYIRSQLLRSVEISPV